MYMGQHRLDVVSLYNRINREVYVMNTLKERRSNAKHVIALMDEIAYLDSIIEPQDCGHLITARNVLYDNATKLVEEIDNGKS
jgi:hypothetical protein